MFSRNSWKLASQRQKFQAAFGFDSKLLFNSMRKDSLMQRNIVSCLCGCRHSLISCNSRVNLRYFHQHSRMSTESESLMGRPDDQTELSSTLQYDNAAHKNGNKTFQKGPNISSVLKIGKYSVKVDGMIDLRLHNRIRYFLNSKEKYQKSCLIYQTLDFEFIGSEAHSEDSSSSTDKGYFRNIRNCSIFKNNIGEMDDDTFVASLLEVFYRRLSPRGTLKKQVHKQCKIRIKTLTSHQILLIADWLVVMDMQNLGYHRKMLDKLSRRVEELLPHNYAQIFYLISLYRDGPAHNVKILLECMDKCLDQFTFTELCMVCVGILKCRPSVFTSPKLVQTVVAHLYSPSIKTETEAFELITALRLVARSYWIDKRQLKLVANELVQNKELMSDVLVPHIARSYAMLRFFHLDLFNLIAHRADVMMKKANSEGRVLRNKDVFMLIWSFSRMNYHPPQVPNLFQDLTNQVISNEEEIQKFPQHFLRTLVALCTMDIYPLELIQRAFHPSLFKKYKDSGYNDVYKYLFIIEKSVAIERPDYQISGLSKKLYVEKGLLNTEYQFPVEKTEEMKGVVYVLAAILGGMHLLQTRQPILPHITTKGDISFWLKEGDPVPAETVAEWTSSLDEKLEDIERIAVLVHLPRHYRLDSKELVGAHVMKKRQLQILGYKVVDIHFWEWKQVSQSQELQQMSYLKKKLLLVSDAKIFR